jgi:hypothetical protein
MVKELVHEVAHSLPSSVKAANEQCCTVTVSVGIHDMGWDNFFYLPMVVIHLKALTNLNTPQIFWFVTTYFLLLY